MSFGKRMSVKSASFRSRTLLSFISRDPKNFSSRAAPTTVFYQRAPRCNHSKRPRIKWHSKSIFRRFCLRARWDCARERRIVNSRRCPFDVPRADFSESSIYASTPCMQMKRVVLRHSLARRASEYNNGLSYWLN